MKDILLKCYRSRAESGKLRFTAYDKMASSRRPSRPDQTLQNMDYYTFAWNQKGPNNVFRVGWFVCGRTKMKDYIRRNGRAGYLMNSTWRRRRRDEQGAPPQDRPTRPPAISSVLNQYDKMASWPLVSILYVRLC